MLDNKSGSLRFSNYDLFIVFCLKVFGVRKEFNFSNVNLCRFFVRDRIYTFVSQNNTN